MEPKARPTAGALSRSRNLVRRPSRPLAIDRIEPLARRASRPACEIVNF